jgi:hypothetical protein
VWFSDVPLDENEGADDDTLLLLKIPKSIIAEYEWIEEGKPYREFLVPASLPVSRACYFFCCDRGDARDISG